ncbi:MAG TPA: glycosyltransferase family 39 protein [Candidatus Acidoferrales bacterium]|nr:glycosyltransferase family 39 protein [Candidatus Acidoferrales bacterium]
MSMRKTDRQQLFWMCVVALALRLALMWFLYPQSLNPHLDHWSFGFEEGRVARALATGHGFSNPLYAPTGPTAWFAPVYPAILAGVFKIFGVYTKAACLAILAFNDLVSALTCIPIFVFSRRSFGASAARVAGWIWAFFPDAVYGPNNRIWNIWLATLLLAILLCMALRLAERNGAREWIAFGALSGVAALTDPVVLSVLPILALWALWRLHRKRARWLTPAICCFVATVVVLSPWFVRNYAVFHRFIPVRDDLGLELAVGNNGDSRFTEAREDGPWLPSGRSQWNEYVTLGETAYFHKKFHEGIAYIEAHPLWYARMVALRIANVWTDYWRLSTAYLAKGPYTIIALPFYTLLSCLTLLGLWNIFRHRGLSAALPYAVVLLCFPVVYYLTHTGDWYRRPMDPFFVGLAAHEVTVVFRKLKARYPAPSYAADRPRIATPQEDAAAGFAASKLAPGAWEHPAPPKESPSP